MTAGRLFAWRVAMHIESFVESFLASQQGQNAIGALAGRGIDRDQAERYLAHAAVVGHKHVRRGHHTPNLLTEKVGKTLLASFATGIGNGDGIVGAFGEGIEGVLLDRVTDALAERARVDRWTAAQIAATVTPYLVSFIHSKLAH